MQQPKKKRTVVRGAEPYIARVQFKKPFNMELLTTALLDVVEALEPAEKAELIVPRSEADRTAHRPLPSGESSPKPP